MPKMKVTKNDIQKYIERLISEYTERNVKAMGSGNHDETFTTLRILLLLNRVHTFIWSGIDGTEIRK